MQSLLSWSLYRPGWSGTHRDPFVLATMPGLNACTTTLSYFSHFNAYFFSPLTDQLQSALDHLLLFSNIDCLIVSLGHCLVVLRYYSKSHKAKMNVVAKCSSFQSYAYSSKFMWLLVKFKNCRNRLKTHVGDKIPRNGKKLDLGNFWLLKEICTYPLLTRVVGGFRVWGPRG